MNIIRCDGCGREVPQKAVELAGERVSGWSAGGLPDGHFDLCQSCSTIAIHAAVTRTGYPKGNLTGQERIDLAGKTNEGWNAQEAQRKAKRT